MRNQDCPKTVLDNFFYREPIRYSFGINLSLKMMLDVGNLKDYLHIIDEDIQ